MADKQQELIEREAEIHGREIAIRETQNQLDRRHEEFSKFEKDYLGKQKEAERLGSSLAKTQSLLDSAQSAHEELENAYSEKKKLYHTLDKRAGELEDKEAKIKEITALLDQKQQILAGKEKEIRSRESETSKREKVTLTTESRLIKEQQELKILKEEISEKQKIVSGLDKELVGLKKGQQQLAIQDEQLKIREEELASRAREIEGRLAEFGAWKDKEPVLRASLDELRVEKSKIEESITMARAELKALSDEWDNRVKIFLENRKYVQNEMKRISQLKLDDLSVLEAKEAELADMVNEMEDDRSVLRDEEDTVIQKIAELTRIEARVKTREQKLADWEVQLKDKDSQVSQRLGDAEKLRKELENKLNTASKVKELKENISKLETEHQKALDLLGKTQAKLIDAGIRLQSKPRLAQLQRQSLQSKEATLRVKEEILSRKESQLQKEEEMVHKEEGAIFEKVLAQEVQNEVGGNRSVKIDSDVYSIMQRANDELRAGNIDNATRYATEAEVMSERLDDNQKRLIMYDIKELKTNIKLAALG